MSKHCSKCNQIKPLEEFHLRSEGNARRSHCKVCTRAQNNFISAQKRGTPKPRLTPEQKRANTLASYRKHNESLPRKAKQAHYEAYRRALKANATPKWLTDTQKAHIAAYYELAAVLTIEFGQQMDVDHIMPLKGKNSCGLHVPWNLQVMSHTFNMSKTNKEDYEY